MQAHQIILKKVRVHNLKDVDLTLRANEFIVFTGVSGSGKSSLAFDTIYVEGQRRYIESLSTFARRYLGDMAKPDVEEVSGLSPTISIEQKSAGKNPRSTVGTMTEIYDYLRVLYARVGIPHCPVSGEPVSPQSKERIIKLMQNMPEGTKLIILAPYARGKKGEFKEDFRHLLRKGYMRARLDGLVIDLSEEVALDKNLAHDVDVVIDRLSVTPENFSRIAEATMQALELGKGTMLVVNLANDQEILYSTHAYSKKSGISYPSLEPNDFSFNSPNGMCPTCHGLGETREFDLDLIIDPEKSIAEDGCSIASSFSTVRYGNIYNNLAKLYHFSVKTPWKDLSERAKHVFLYGTEKKWILMHFTHPIRPVEWTEYIGWRGVLHEARQRYMEAKSEKYRKRIEKLMKEQLCPSCLGARLKPYPAATLLAGKKIHELTHMTIAEASAFFLSIVLSKEEEIIADELLKEIKSRLNFLIAVGLHYLTLERTSPTLSGGEAQRVRLASQVGSGLVGVTYVLDEPSIGLHPHDNERLLVTLKHLRDVGNTVIVVEHDEETIWAADRIVDFGPGPGQFGGEILVNGSLRDLIENKLSLTGAYLSGKKEIAVPKVRRPPGTEALQVEGASHNNLKNVTAKIPLGLLVAVTGVSGSGKSSLISDTLFPAIANRLHGAEYKVGKHKRISGLKEIDKVIAIDQSPIGRNPRSNPSTYIKIFDEIRVLFSKLPESQARGYLPGRFSFNVRDGSCPQCHGLGMLRIDMDFLEDTWIPCASCKSKRFDHETLSILYKGKSIYDVLEMTVEEARDFFANIPHLKHKLDLVARVGMGYIKLGQPSTTLSGGEAQRIKLAKELVRPSSGKTLYILDEPTTGLHFYDIHFLLDVLHELVDRGNTVLIIEHNMDVIKTADWIIDIGPEGGAFGGEVVATGTPETIAQTKTPTGKALYHALHPDREKKVKELLSQPRTIEKVAQEIKTITIKGAEQNNLKHLDLTIPRNAMTVCTGPSGSGKSSLAFETIYAEGQRRYIESLSPYARQFVKQMPKPKIAQIEGLSPAVAIEQKQIAGNPRSTAGTMTEVYDYLRILYARAGVAYAPDTGEIIRSITKDFVVEQILKLPEGEKIAILAPITIEKNEKFEDLVHRFRRLGYLRLRLNGEIFEIDQEIPFDRRRKNEIALVIDRLKIARENESRLYEAIENATHLSGNKAIVTRENNSDLLYNLAFAVESTGKSYPEITPQSFSFNSPEGMCLECQGLGYQYGANLSQHPEIMELSLFGLLNYLWTVAPPLSRDRDSPYVLLQSFLNSEGIDPYQPLKELEAKDLNLIFNGAPEGKWIEAKGGFRFHWLGIQPVLAKAAKIARNDIREHLIPILDEMECLSCQGARLHPLARNVRIQERTIASLCRLNISSALAFIETIELDAKKQKLLEEVMGQLKSRLHFLIEIGLHYLSLDRRAPTLSNGEAQRIRLARQLGSSLTGVLYVLDEPTIGLHPQENERLNRVLKKLKDLGNTLLVVEHDPLTVAAADFILDFGPGAGIHGGHVVAQGSYKEILKNPHSLTGGYLSGREKIETPKKRRVSKDFFVIENAKVHNLKNISLKIPVGVFTCFTGVSGSGKSTLMNDIIRPTIEKQLLKGAEKVSSITFNEATVSGGDVFNKLIVIDQDPIGHTSRSDVGTYVDALPVLREFYASLALARTKGLQPRHFSYNHRKGMCTTCWGMGYKKVEMYFLPPVRVLCDQCHGLRLNPVSLEVTYQDLNFGQILDHTVEEARSLFEIIPKATRIFDTLISVGLGYLKLGQEIASLSGGEAQRMKLSRELSKRGTGKTLYLLDEPTTGLHPEDIKKLLGVIHRLVDKGNTMIVIEHNLDVIKSADHLVDLGPEAGVEGGHIVCEGAPEKVAKHRTSYTAKFLRKILDSIDS